MQPPLKSNTFEKALWVLHGDRSDLFVRHADLLQIWNGLARIEEHPSGLRASFAAIAPVFRVEALKYQSCERKTLSVKPISRSFWMDSARFCHDKTSAFGPSAASTDAPGDVVHVDRVSAFHQTSEIAHVAGVVAVHQAYHRGIQTFALENRGLVFSATVGSKGMRCDGNARGFARSGRGPQRPFR